MTFVKTTTTNNNLRERRHSYANLCTPMFASHLRPVSRKSRKRLGPETPFLKLQPAYSVKLVFWYVVKGILFKITAKFRASRRLRFEDTKRIMSPEIRPKSFGTFEKRAPDPSTILTTEAGLLQYYSTGQTSVSTVARHENRVMRCGNRVARDEEKPSLDLDYLAILRRLARVFLSL